MTKSAHHLTNLADGLLNQMWWSAFLPYLALPMLWMKINEVPIESMEWYQQETNSRATNWGGVWAHVGPYDHLWACEAEWFCQHCPALGRPTFRIFYKDLHTQEGDIHELAEWSRDRKQWLGNTCLRSSKRLQTNPRGTWWMWEFLNLQWDIKFVDITDSRSL